MDDLILLQPDETMLDEINAYRKSMLDAGSSMDGTGPLGHLEAIDWLCATRNLLKEETCPLRGCRRLSSFVYVRQTGVS